MIETADAIVVGAGVQGASLAFHLARRGVRVTVLERSSIAAGATGRPRTVHVSVYELRRFAEGRLLVGEHDYGVLWR